MTNKNLHKTEFKLPFEEATKIPQSLLQLDRENPRLKIGSDLPVETDEELISSLYDISALDELVTSICSNKYLNLEPMIVVGDSDSGPFRVLEGNRRLAAIKLILDSSLAQRIGINIPTPIPDGVVDSIQKILVFRVKEVQDSRAFIGFKHINGPQRWDAYAKARYATDWYKSSNGSVAISEIASKIGDNNNTLRSYIYSLLILEQVEKAGLWSLKNRTNAGRFAFSHFYTALGRKEYQEFLGLEAPWSDTPGFEPLDKSKLEAVAEILSYIYGSKNDDRPALVKSQNPDLKDVGLAITNEDAIAILRNRGTLDEARDALKDPSDAFYDALIQANLKIQRAIKLLPKYSGGNAKVDDLVNEIFEQADTLQTMNEKKKNKNI